MSNTGTDNNTYLHARCFKMAEGYYAYVVYLGIEVTTAVHPNSSLAMMQLDGLTRKLWDRGVVKEVVDARW